MANSTPRFRDEITVPRFPVLVAPSPALNHVLFLRNFNQETHLVRGFQPGKVPEWRSELSKAEQWCVPNHFKIRSESTHST